MSIAKIFGWLLLFSGLAVIIYPLYSSYTIFTVKKPAPEIFEIVQQEQAGTAIEQQLQEMLGEILPAESINGLLNLIAWSIFASILIFGGSKISGLGIRLLRSK